MTQESLYLHVTLESLLRRHQCFSGCKWIGLLVYQLALNSSSTSTFPSPRETLVRQLGDLSAPHCKKGNLFHEVGFVTSLSTSGHGFAYMNLMILSRKNTWTVWFCLHAYSLSKGRLLGTLPFLEKWGRNFWASECVLFYLNFAQKFFLYHGEISI